ncbi:MAG: protease SohB [Candidatus Thiodiazotropha sp. (ex Cardiolucina cf. quadrata)]|nr:protease SohB [Candidatus Thiodiazotropha sp. (ex Cardiolucina cf. quadrata)]
MEFVTDYSLFLAKSITVVLAILAIVGGIIALAGRGRPRGKQRLEVKYLNRDYDDLAHALKAAMLPKKAFKQILKTRKQDLKKSQKLGPDARSKDKKRVFVLNFHGDIRASAVASLREEITVILSVARPEDEVVLRLESSGGLVHAYGLAASQLTRLKDKNIRLTIAVDKVAASGGYLMACVADHIIAAPFAVVGSIGVLAQLPNFNRFLKRHDIDFEQFTAGEYKRTVTLFGENTDKDRDKFREEIDEAHRLFKAFIKSQRSELDIETVATGEHWYGTRALELKLVDELCTSDDYLLEARKTAELYQVTFRPLKSLIDRLSSLPSIFDKGLLGRGRSGYGVHEIE